MFGCYAIYVILLPVHDLVKLAPDDAFYYFTIARNVATGHGPTFDGISPCSGFHPLYLLLLLPIFSLWGGNAELAVRASVAVCAILYYFCGLLLYILVKKIADKGTGLIALCILLTTPSLAVMALGGLETSLSLLMILLSMIAFVGVTISEGNAKCKKWLLLGLLVGLAVLARTDNVFLLLGVVLALIVSRRQPNTVSNRSCLPRLVASAIGLPLLFMLWSYIETGQLFQSSGAALTAYSWQVASPSSMHASGSFLDLAGRFILDAARLTGLSMSALVVLGVMLVAVAAVSELAFLSMAARRLILLLPLCVHTALLAAFYAGWLRHIQPWYLMPASLLFCALSTLLLGGISEGVASLWPRRRHSIGGTIKATIAILVVFWGIARAPSVLSEGLYPWQPEMLNAAVALSRLTNGGERVGAFNAGMLGYLLKGQVVNLDGVVNNRVLPHLTNHTLDRYLRETRIDYLIDYQRSLLEFSRATTKSGYPGFRLSEELPGSWDGSNLWVCRRGDASDFLDPSMVQLASGFYPAEVWPGAEFKVRWSKGRTSEIAVIPADENVDLEVTVWAMPFERCDERRQRVAVSVNGEPRGELEVRSGWQKYSIDFPASSLNPGRNTVALTYQFTVCPARDCEPACPEWERLAGDERELAVAFGEVRIQRKRRSMAIAAPSSLLLGTTKEAASLTSGSALSTATPNPAF
ncbi:MAG: glycosyltransferase family 39 protein [Candidatus Coatesbacteria bacterium]|nr:glycosyltransferase family 39 protein [Candidatus Coatesbacteria bacterium]